MRSIAPPFFLLLLLSTALPVQATLFGYSDLRYSPGMNCIQFNDPGKAVSFSFVTPADRGGRTISYVKFFVQSAVSPSFPLVVELRADNGGLPGDLLTQGMGAPDSLSSYFWFRVNLSPFTLVSGQRYHIVIHPSDGCGSLTQYINVGLQFGRYRSDMSLILDLGQGWFTAPNSDPTFVAGFTDGVEWGQPYGDRGSYISIYGSGTNSRCGERFQLTTPMNARKLSVVVRRKGWPADLRVSLYDELAASTVLDEKFCSASDVSFWDQTWASHVFASPVALTSDRAYRLSLYQDGQQGDSNNCYVVHYQYSGSGAATFGGTNSRYFTWNMSTGYFMNFWNYDMYFQFDTGGIEVQRINSFRVTSTQATLVVETNKVTEATVEYGMSTSYGYSVTSGAGTLHTFVLSGLSPGAIYHYRFDLTDPADATDTLVTQDCRFKTDPLDQPINVTVFGDSQSMDSNSFFSLMAQYPHDIIVTTGDCVDLHDLPAGELTYDRAYKEWKWLLHDITPMTENAALFTCLGNHDSHFFINPAPLQGYNAAALMPTNGSGDGRYYSFDYGPAHFCILDSQEVDSGTVGPAQLAWAENDLGSSNKSFKIVALHIPVCGLAPDDLAYQIHNPTQLHDMFKRVGVRLVLQGHRHEYNRYYKDGICYIITGLPDWLTSSAATYEQGYTNMVSKANVGGEPGTIPAYINKPGWVQLRITSNGFSGAYVNLFGQELDSFSTYAPDPSVPAPMSIGKAKHQNTGCLVDLTGTVTSTQDDWTQRVYIEDDVSRTGVWVTFDVPTTLERGDYVHITGSLVMDSNEQKVSGRLISAPVTSAGPPQPVSISSAAIAGGPMGFWQGIYGARGVGSTGSLVRMVGIAKNVDSPHSAFYLWDGSSLLADNNLKGSVRVECGSGAVLPREGSWCSVVGISSCKKISNKLYVILRPRDANDMQSID